MIMFNSLLKAELADVRQQYNKLTSLIDSIDTSVATIRFTPDGIVEAVNDNFLSVIGYEKSEVIGQHHKIFCDADYVKSSEYKGFWEDLCQGKKKTGTFKRITKTEKVVWLDATYFPILNTENKVIAIFKIASDVTNMDNKRRDLEAAFNALDRSMAIIEFTADGYILNANENFLATVGYSLQDVVGKHHRIFCFDRFYEENPNFWTQISSGNFFYRSI